jgi:hypothetical protein
VEKQNLRKSNSELLAGDSPFYNVLVIYIFLASLSSLSISAPPFFFCSHDQALSARCRVDYDSGRAVGPGYHLGPGS